MTTLKINGRPVAVDTPPDTPLLWVLRDELGMTGTKFGCGMALCAVGDQAVSTIDAMADDRVGRVVQAAWVELGVAQCGYCQAGQIMSAVALLKQQPKPSERQIDEAMNSNICRCGTYPRIRAAIQLAASRLQGAK